MESRRILFALSTLLVAALACTIGQAAPRRRPAGDDHAQALTLQAPSQTPGRQLRHHAALTNTPTVPR